MADFEPFHSAVNRIPLPRPAVTRAAGAGSLPGDLFADGAAPGHDHLSPDRWSGSMDLEMTVRTPLVFGEQGEHNGQACVDLPIDAQGRLVMPATMVKGMISRAYETLTCSRFRVFGDVGNRRGFRRTADTHSRQLTYRGDAASALRLVPIRISAEDEHGLIGELFYGDTQVNDYCKERGHVYPTMYAANFHAGGRGHSQLRINQRRLDTMAAHGRKLRCHLTLCLHGDGGKGARYAYWQVTHIHNGREFLEVIRIPDSVTTIEDLDDVTGYVCRTTPPDKLPNQLFDRKHNERFFFDVSGSGPTKVRIVSDVRERYRAVVDSYVLQRQNDPKTKRRTPNRATHQVLRAGSAAEAELAASLKVGDLGFAVVKDPDNDPEVVEIVPTMIGRHAYSMSPAELAAAQQVLPLSTAGEASAADRLFGYVINDVDDGAKGGDVAARGRIVIGPIDGSDARVVTDAPRLLAPLLAPKPGSARRFLTDRNGKTPLSADRKTPSHAERKTPSHAERKVRPAKRSEYFTTGQYLGGSAYPVHRSALGAPDFPRQATAVPDLNGQEQDNANVRLEARSWLRAGSVLRCTLSFTNLSANELAALIWVLTPENLVPASEQDDERSKQGYLRMGLGKPFGLGVVEVRIAPDGLRACRGEDLAHSYASLGGCLGEGVPVVSASRFKIANIERLVKMPWVQAMQRAAFGYADGIEVRYMSLKENKRNNQTDGCTDKPHEGTGVAPRELFCTESGKPIRVSPEKRIPEQFRGRSGARWSRY